MSVDNETRTAAHPLDRFWLPGAAVLLSAFALRVYALAAQSLWNDEGTSIALSRRSLEAIADGAAKDIHPPLYYFLLHFWMPLAGESEFAVRFLSVAAGVLLIAFTVRLAGDLFGEEAALVAGLLSAFSPFQIYYSQETRMYIWVALWSAVSVWAMVRMLTSPTPLPPSSPAEREGNKGYWGDTPHDPPSGALPLNPKALATSLLYIGATVAALYTHYFAPAVVLAENICFLVWLVLAWRAMPLEGGTLWQEKGTLRRAFPTRVGRTLMAWVATQLAIGLAFLPWYLYAGNQLAAWPSISEPFDLPTLVWRVLNVFSSGRSLDGPAATITALALGVLAIGGLLPARGRRTIEWATVLLGLWVLVPVGVMYAVSLSRPAYDPKFLLLATPPFFILATRGLSLVWVRIFPHDFGTEQPWLASLCSVLVVAMLAVVGFFPSLRNYYSDPHYARDDYRTILRYIDTNGQPGDGILVDAPGQADVVRYYHRGEQPLFLLPTGRPPERGATLASVDEMLDRVQRLYAIYWATEQADPERLIESRLAERAFKARDEWHGNVRLAVYGIAPPARPPAQAIDAEFGGEIRLTGYQLDKEQARAGGLLTLTLYWQVEHTPSGRYKVFVHLLDAENRVVAQRDGEPVGDLRSTTSWRAGETIADPYGVLTEPETPPGEYRIEVGLYHAEGGARLPILGSDGRAQGDHIILDSVRISR